MPVLTEPPPAPATAQATEAEKTTSTVSTLERLKKLDYATPERITQREKEASEMVFVLPGIAARGQSTIIYADANSGKTLLVFKMLRDQSEAGELKDLKIVYCNFDDDFKGANQKGRYVQDLPEVMMIDNQETTVEEVFQMMADSIEDGTAKQLCFVLDTAIRFVSDSDKKSQREFTSLVQRFVSAQGTVIALGHVNKHKSAEGKSVHGGTGDIRNSFSQCALLELETPKDDTDRRVKFYNDKLRGMAAVSTSYRYKHGDERTWLERVETVERIHEAEAKRLTRFSKSKIQAEKDAEIIEEMVAALSQGPKSHTYLTKQVEIGTRSERAAALSRYTDQNEFPEFQIWGTSRGQTGGLNFHLLENRAIR